MIRLAPHGINFRTLIAACGVTLCAAMTSAEDTAPLGAVALPSCRSIAATPDTAVLTGPRRTFTLLIDGTTEDGRLVDLTHAGQYRSENPQVAEVSATGVIRGVTDGVTRIHVEAAGHKLQIPVQVSDSQVPRRFNFENDIVPILSKFGCNMSGCHGKAEGQNGFKLSVFGFDPKADFVALTQEGRGRRVFAPLPENSLLLSKAVGRLPHGGGIRLARTSDEYQTLEEWITAGIPFGEDDDPHVVSIEVAPRERRMAFKTAQQLRVIATYSDGKRVDVTRHARFQSNKEGLGAVNEAGLVTAGEVPGEVAVMASYMGAVDIFRALLPRAEAIANYPALPENNFIDGLVYRKLRNLNVLPSELTSDADYLRRVYLDVIGTLPTAEEARTFLSDSRPDRRARLVDELLTRPQFADFWALKWADVLRVDRQQLGHKRAYAYYHWIRESLVQNKPYDQFCREIIGAEGPLNEVPAGSIYKVVTNPGQVASAISQVFLGVRIECAQCHHHPFDRWSQTDYYGMQAFFTQVSFKGPAGKEVLLAAGETKTMHPRTNEEVFAHALGAESPEKQPAGDRRQLLATWITSPENPWFARNFVNRTWAHFLGRGLIEPVDDLRLTNPASNTELLDALARSFVEQKFDFRALIRTITASRVYQLSATPNETNERDDQNYSRGLFKRLDAEVLLDAISQTTGVDEKFPGLPSGYRAVQVWDSQLNHYFLKLFGRPTRATACECERKTEPSVAQVLHVMNSPELQEKLSREGGRIARLASTISNDASLVEELYLTFYGRFPTEAEQAATVGYLGNHQGDRRKAAEDIAWSMLNSPEFIFNH